MTKNTMMTLINYLNSHDIPELVDAKTELNAQYEKDAAKAQTNRDLYAAAKDVVMRVVSDTPMTVADIFSTCESDLPEGFTKSKMQYAVRTYWADVLEKHENGKGAFTYSKKA